LLDRIILFTSPLALGLLKRGYLLLIAGGVAVAASLTVLGYYGMRLVEALEGDSKSVNPSGSIEISKNLTGSGQGAYVAAFPKLDGLRPNIVISGPSGGTVLQKSVDQLIVLEAFPIAEAGVYVLELSNPSPTLTLQAAVILDSQEAVLSKAGALSPVITVVFGFMLVAGVGALAAGAVITFVDRRRLGKMKQFGDTSDLV
jgi:hypothetical protein